MRYLTFVSDSTGFMYYIDVLINVCSLTLVRLYLFQVMFGVITPLASKQPISTKRQMTGFRCNSQVVRDCNACPCHITLVYLILVFALNLNELFFLSSWFIFAGY